MKYGAKMTENVRTLILEYSKWEDEKDQLTKKRDISERKKYLVDFREKAKNYKDGEKITIPIERLTEIMEKSKVTTFVDNYSIHYKN